MVQSDMNPKPRTERDSQPIPAWVIYPALIAVAVILVVLVCSVHWTEIFS